MELDHTLTPDRVTCCRRGTYPVVLIPYPARSEEDLGGGMDGQAGERADDRAVDADELQVPPDLQFDLAGGLDTVPALDGVGDQGRDLAGVMPHDVGGGAFHPAVCLGPQL